MMDNESLLTEGADSVEFTHLEAAPEDTPQPATPSVDIDLGSSAFKAAWDWDGEATWWRDNFCNSSNNKRCRTNRTGSYSGGFCDGSGSTVMTGMSASHESTAEIRYYEYSCNQCWLIGTCCKWRREVRTTAAPRQWKRYTRQNSSGKAFEVEGLGSTPRVHDENSYNALTANGYNALCSSSSL